MGVSEYWGESDELRCTGGLGRQVMKGKWCHLGERQKAGLSPLFICYRLESKSLSSLSFKRCGMLTKGVRQEDVDSHHR